MAYALRGLFWISLYGAVATTPLFVLLLGPTPPGRGFWWEFHVALAFAGAAVMGMMFHLTARSRRMASPFGMDVIYYFHRWIAVVCFVFILIHIGTVFALEPTMASLLVPGMMPLSLRTGVIGAAALTIVIVTSLWRQQLGIDYEIWRLWHASFSVVAVTFAIVHMELVGYYLSDPWKRWLWAALGLSWAGTLAYTRLVKPFDLIRHPYRVVEVRKERGDAWTLALEPDGHDGISFSAGQFAWVTLRHSPFALKEHPFSFASSSEKPRLEFTIKELGDFTSRIGEVTPGEKAYLAGPYGSFCPDRHDAQGYVLVAGGIGIAPMMSILRTFSDREDKRPLLLLYVVKTLEAMTYRAEIEALQEKLNLFFVPVLTQPAEEWDGERGRIDEAMLTRHLPDHRSSCEYFVCGPVLMTKTVERTLNRQRVPLENIHSELFDLV